VSIKAAFNAECEGCGKFRPGCAVCCVNGTNAFGDRDARVLTLCGPCRKECRGRCILHPKHKAGVGHAWNEAGRKESAG
jgi:hypothetical protein